MGGVGVMVMSVMFGGKTMCMGDNLEKFKNALYKLQTFTNMRKYYYNTFFLIIMAICDWILENLASAYNYKALELLIYII